MEKTNFGHGINDYGKTEPVGGFSEFNGSSTEPVGVSDWDMGGNGGGFAPTTDAPGSGFTMPGGGFGPTEPLFQPEDTSVTEPVTPNNVYGFMPVVGWFVCIEGVDRGRDYRIHSGYNTIGRDASNDICISGDMKITRERHAMVAFDEQECLFFFAPGNGKNLVRLNNRVLMMPSELHSGDVLTIGSSKLMFMPFCSESFSWERHE